MELNNVILYRITHIENVPHILQYGITLKDSVNSNPDYKGIGDLSLINNRSNKEVVVDNGKIDEGFKPVTTILGRYIPFYFGVRMPMLYVAQHGGNFVEQATPPGEIVYLACSLDRILKGNFEYIFTDGHATDMLTTFFDASHTDKLVELIDWEAVKSSYWGGNENLNTKRKKQAEFLVSGDLPPNLITGFGCYNNDAKDKLISFGIQESKIKVLPKAYY